MQASGLGFREYVEALEEEQRKIQVFQRELPLCLELVTQAIERCRQQLSGTMTEYLHGQSECSGQTSSEGHVFEEFMPIKRTSSSDNEEEDDNEQQSPKFKTSEKDKNNGDKKKSDWMRSVQLWNPTPDPPLKEDLPRKASVMEVKRNGGAFQPFQREKSVAKPNGSVAKVPPSAPATSSSSGQVTVGSGGLSSKREDKEGQRKQRRNWSPELHRRFLNALQQLGGSHTATPKQIRELMKVDGLTNDEVKSHLQKYRLHTRRPSPSIHHNNGNAQAPQIVLVGGIWMPPPDYAAVATTSAPGENPTVTAANGIYAPVAALPPTAPQATTSLTKRPQQKRAEPSHSEERVSHSEGGVHSNSPATSSSTHTTTTSPMF